MKQKIGHKHQHGFVNTMFQFIAVSLIVSIFQLCLIHHNPPEPSIIDDDLSSQIKQQSRTQIENEVQGSSVEEKIVMPMLSAKAKDPSTTRSRSRSTNVNEENDHSPLSSSFSSPVENSPVISISTTETNRTSISDSSPQHLLSVPFYLYEDEILRNESVYNFTDICIGTQLMKPGVKADQANMTAIHQVCATITTFEDMVSEKVFISFIESTEFQFVRSALDHPMRTKDPSKAKIFVVPTLLSLPIFSHQYNPALFQKQLPYLQNLDEALEKSEWFEHSNGADHIVIIGVFLPGFLSHEGYLKHVPSCNVVQWFEGAGTPAQYPQRFFQKKEMKEKRVLFPNMYVSSGQCTPSSSTSTKTQNITFIGSLEHKRKRCGECNFRLRHRRDGCLTIARRTNWTTAVCGNGDKCPNLSNALLGMHFEGDTPSASRLSETILSGTIPVFTTKEQYDSVPDFIDWDKISYFADVKNRTRFVESLDLALTNETEIALKTENVMKNKAIFDWENGYVTFDVYMYMLQSRLYPDTRAKSSHFSALKMDYGHDAKEKQDGDAGKNE